ncbi:MAG TPA: hypothetical protein VGX28_00145 [Frankiaceae bacterium]|nr:hypothetical protein [Frankiaceae bacterium]
MIVVQRYPCTRRGAVAARLPGSMVYANGWTTGDAAPSLAGTEDDALHPSVVRAVLFVVVPPFACSCILVTTDDGMSA